MSFSPPLPALFSIQGRDSIWARIWANPRFLWTGRCAFHASPSEITYCGSQQIRSMEKSEHYQEQNMEQITGGQKCLPPPTSLTGLEPAGYKNAICLGEQAGLRGTGIKDQAATCEEGP